MQNGNAEASKTNCRHKNTDEYLTNLIHILQLMEDALREVVDNHTPFVKAAEKYGLNYDNLRSTIRKIENIPNGNGKPVKKDNEFMSPQKALFTPYENAFCEIMDIPYSELAAANMPDGFGEALERVIPMVLPEQKAVAFCSYVSGNSFKEIAEDLSVTPKQARGLYLSARKKLRNYAGAGTMLSEGLRAWEERQAEICQQRAGLMEAVRKKREQGKQELAPDPDIIDLDVSCLNLSARSYYALMRANCRTVGQLWSLIHTDGLPGIKNIGERTQAEIQEKYQLFIMDPEKGKAALRKKTETGLEGTDIDCLNLSRRAQNALRHAGCMTMGQLSGCIWGSGLASVRNIGTKTEAEIIGRYKAFMAQEDHKGQGTIQEGIQP